MKNTVSANQENISNFILENNINISSSFRTFLHPLEIYFEDEDEIVILHKDKEDIGAFLEEKFLSVIEKAIFHEIGKKFSKIQFISKYRIKEFEEKKANEKNRLEIARSANLNTNYTFSNFIVGDNNNFARNAALAVSENPGGKNNPLFIYGGAGLGKTHLMHSIGNYIFEKDSSKKILYVTSEKFTNELIESIKFSGSDNTAPTEFRKKYRSIDVLLIDDIQFIIGKESTQEEFFHTFNELYMVNKQIIISSDKSPKDYTDLEERLLSRFQMGLSVQIQLPTYETRMAILKKKCETEGIELDNEILNYIAVNIKSNIRELEGALNKVVNYAKFYSADLTLENVEEALRDVISPNAISEISVDSIIETVAEHFSISKENILSSTRTRNIAFPRQICMYLAKTQTECTYEDIGKQMGNRDHSTVHHGNEKIISLLKEEEKKGKTDLKNTLDVLIKKLSP